MSKEFTKDDIGKMFKVRDNIELDRRCNGLVFPESMKVYFNVKFVLKELDNSCYSPIGYEGYVVNKAMCEELIMDFIRF